MGSRARATARALGGLEVGLLLWRVQLKMFLNQTVRSRQPGRIAGAISGAAVVVLAWFWEAVVTSVAVQAARRATVSVDLVHLLSLAFLIYTAVLIFTSLVFSLNALLTNPDLDLLLPAPRPVETILAGRMVTQVIRLMLLSLLFTGPALLVVAVATRNPLLPFAFTALYLLYPVFVVVIVSLLSLLLIRLVPQGRGTEIVTLLSVALALGVNVLNFLFNPALRNSGFRRGPSGPPPIPDISAASVPWLPSGWAGRIGAAVLNADWLSAAFWGLILLTFSIAVFRLGAMLSGRLYLAGWIQAVPPRRRHRIAKGWRLQDALPLLSPVVAAIVIKDWRIRTRDMTQLVRFAMPAVFLVIIFGFRFPQVVGAVRGLGQGPAAAMLGVFPAWVLLFSLSISLGLTAVSLEGKGVWVYAASPNTTLRFVQAKCWSAALPTAAVVGLVALAAEIVVRPGWLWGVAAVLLVIIQAATLTTLMVGIGAAFARFDWTDARRMLNPFAALIGTLLYGLISGLSALVLLISVALASATGFPITTTFLAAIAVTAGGSTALAALGMLIGTERLSGLDLG